MNRIAKNGPWLHSVTTTSNALGSILLSRDAKRYAKFIVTVNTELENLSFLNFLLLIEIAIAEPSNPVLSRAAKNVLGRFPSWMSMYQDSLDQATPDLYIPKSTAGKFVNSILGENLDNFDREIDLYRINSFIDRADTDQLAWIYSSTNVTNVFNKVLTGTVELARVDNIVDFYKSKPTDFIFYHNPVNREILTLKQYGDFSIKNENTGIITALDQTPILKFNWFDELGARVGLSRLYLESNASFKERILDVFKNPNGADLESFKKVLRRELNLWKAFGVEPSSSYLGATPEILEISDLEYSTPYFTADGNPTKYFKDLVEELNIRYPTNWGYFKFGESIWDYAGDNNEGVNRIHSRYYDDELDILYYQPGVGDLSDGKITIQNYDATPKFFETTIVAKGKRKIATTTKYEPILFDYEYYGSYEITEYNNPAATVNFTLEFHATPHGSYATPTVFSAPLTLYPKNNFSPTNSASPEFHLVNIFDTEGYVSTDLSLVDKNTLQPYRNTKSTVTASRLDINKVQNILLKNGLWNGTSYATPNSDNFIAKFSHRNPSLNSSSTSLSATPNFAQDTKLQVVSKLYTSTQNTKYTTAQTSSIIINNEATPPGIYSIDQDRIIKNIIMPVGATPKYVYINNIKPRTVETQYVDDSSQYSGFGGVSYYLETDKDTYIPSSPNIIVNYYGSNLATPSANSQIGSTTVNSGHATASYYFTEMHYPYSGTPNSLTVTTQNSDTYPFSIIEWEAFQLTSSTPISGYVDENGIVNYNSAQGEYVPGKNTDSILIPELTRESFGLSGSSKFEYFFETIEIIDPLNLDVSIWSEQKIVNPFLNRTYVLQSNQISEIYQDIDYTTKSISYPDNSIIESYDLDRNTTVFSNFIARGKLFDSKLDTRINTGWINVGKNEYYIYSKPVTRTFSGRLKEISLPEIPRQGAPVIVNVSDVGSSTPNLFTEIAFPDESTPRQFGFYNTEVLQPRFDNSFYLGYKNVYDLSITDGLTGQTLLTELETEESFIAINTNIYKFVKGRDYYIRYKVRDSYYLDNILDGEDYYSTIVFDATPNATMNYSVIYESSIYERSTPVGLNFGQTSSLLDEGYVILSNAIYPFDFARMHFSNNYILDDGKDFITISIVSLDSEGNPKPYQSFELWSSDSSFTFANEIITTDDEGYASTTAVYSGTKYTTNMKIPVGINGVNQLDNPLAHADSESSGFSKHDYVELYASNKPTSELIATANPDRINADGISSVIISGILTDNKVPASNKSIYWRKARTLYSVLNNTNYSTSQNVPTSSSTAGVVFTDSNGKFQIGPIVSQDRATPGYWFMVVDSELQETITSDPNTVAGDTVFWYESYDNIDINYVQNLKIPDIINYNLNNSLDLYATPMFITSYYNHGIVEVTGSTPLWQPPKWYPLDMYGQYQSGYLGSTPYMVSDYSNINIDHKD